MQHVCERFVGVSRRYTESKAMHDCADPHVTLVGELDFENVQADSEPVWKSLEEK